MVLFYKKKHAFSLIESAIVLGVVGLIIGGIWLAASTVQENLRISKTVEGILFIAMRAQETMPRSEGTASWRDITTAAIAMGMVPQDWVQDGTKVNPLGGNFIIANRTGVIELYIYGLNESRCRRLLGQLAKSTNTTFISGVWNDDKLVSTSFPTTYENTICNPPITVLDFGILLSRIN